MHAIYDDHDFGMDDCVSDSSDHPSWKRSVLKNFKKIGIIQKLSGGQNPCWQIFLGEVQFIMRFRYYRDRKENLCLELFKNNVKDTLVSRVQLLKLRFFSTFFRGDKTSSKDHG